MSRRGPKPRSTFAEIVKTVPPDTRIYDDEDAEAIDFSDPARFIDGDGVAWRRRGTGPVDEKRLLKLLEDPEVRVLHLYIHETNEIHPAERQSFWAAAQASMEASAHSDFSGVEFKNDRHQHLLLIQESC